MRWPLALVAICACADESRVELEEVSRIGDVARYAQTLDGMPIWGGDIRLRGDTITGRLIERDRPRSSYLISKPSHGLVRDVWYPSGEALIAAWVVDAYESNGEATRTIFAGDDGRVLERYSLTANDFDFTVFADATGQPLDGPQQDATPHPTGAPDGSYPPYLAGPTTIRTNGFIGDPWLPPGATETVGNNVDAYADFNMPNGLSDGDFRATVSSAATFAYVYDFAREPLATNEQQQASIVSLFYTVNWLHDFWYTAGFNEAAGNAQRSNYGRGGAENDPLLAEAQDNALGGSRNNANMSTPADGLSPRMQVFLWSGKDDRAMSLQPSGRTPPFGTASFGPKDYDATGSVVVGSPADGCMPITNSVAGNFVVVDRGNCTYARKTLNVQNAGGIGVIIVNHMMGTTPPTMGNDSALAGTTFTIPTISLTNSEGALLKQDIAAGPVTITVRREIGTEVDGALDATLVAHEFGHYLHHRLSLCSNTMCRAMSEGWGDFTALMLIAREGDDLMGAFPFSIYATQGFANDPGYYGIRRAPYSADFAINALTFGHMADGAALPTTHPILSGGVNSQVHNAGEVWAASLWEVYVALQRAGTSFDATRAKMARYVVEGLALMPAETTPMQARDAILAAADPADRDLMLAAFARRGFGSCASPPPPNSVDFVGLRESMMVSGNAELVTMGLEESCDGDGILDTGETARVKLQVINRGHTPLTNVDLKVTSSLPGVTIVSPPTAVAELVPGASIDLDAEVTLEPGLTDLVSGSLALEVTSANGCADRVEFSIATRFNSDDRPASSMTDTFDAKKSPWVAWASGWTHVFDDAFDGHWHGDDLGVLSDVRLTSPVLRASSSGPVTLTFKHRFDFELGDGQAWDGGVIEFALGTSETWQELASVASVPYNGALAPDTGNTLATRLAFIGQNPSFPSEDTVTIDLAALKGERFRLRFRIGTDGGVGATGWDIDDVAFTGLVNKPFPSLVPDDGDCSPDDKITSGGGGCCDTRGSANGVLPLSVVALMLRRRRRR